MIENTPQYTLREEGKVELLPNVPSQEKEPLIPNVISMFLHPMLMGVYTIALLFLYTDFNLLFAGQFIRFISPVLFLTCIVPVSGMYFLQRSGLVKDYENKNTFDRLVPTLTIFLSYSLLIYYFHSARLFIWFLSILVVPLVLTAITSIINLKWKVSIHMLAFGALIGSTLSVCYNVKGLNPFILFIILFILAGSLGVSRLMLKRETPSQVYIGFLIGLVTSYLVVLFGAYWGIIVFLKNFN